MIDMMHVDEFVSPIAIYYINGNKPTNQVALLIVTDSTRMQLARVSQNLVYLHVL